MRLNLQVLPKRAIGLDISDTSVEALEISKRMNRLNITASSRCELEPGIVNDGLILKKEVLAKQIRQMIAAARPSGFHTKNAIISLPESKTFIHIFRMPAVISQENIGESVQFEAEEIIPLSFNQLYHDYQVLEIGNEVQEVLYVAGYKEVTDILLQTVKAAGLHPLIVEPESLALARSLVFDKEKNTLLVDIGARTTIITVYARQAIRYSHNLPVGTRNFRQAIMDSKKVGEAESERLLRTIGLIKGSVKGIEDLDFSQEIKKISIGINKALDYMQKSSGLTVENIILCGGGSLIPGLEEYLKASLHAKVVLGRPFFGLKLNEFQAPKDDIFFSTVVGLAKRGVSQDSLKEGINLINDTKRKLAFSSKDKISRGKKFFSEKVRFFISRSNLSSINKRSVILLAIFGILLVIFIVLLIVSNNQQEPLVNFQHYDYPTRPVNY